MFRLGLGINLNTPSSRGTQTLFYNPIALFSNGEEGAWYEPSTTTAFRSTTDLTPCSYGDACGFLLDKSKGAGYSGGSFTGLGSELVAGGEFNDAGDLAAWTADSAAISLSHDAANQRMQVVTTSFLSNGFHQDITTVAGAGYFVSIDATRSDINTRAYDGASFLNAINVGGTDTLYFIAESTTTRIYFRCPVGSATYFVDNISVRELPGNHATQSNPDARPLLQQTAGGLYYLEFDGADDFMALPDIPYNSDTGVNAFMGADTTNLQNDYRAAFGRISDNAVNSFGPYFGGIGGNTYRPFVFDQSFERAVNVATQTNAVFSWQVSLTSGSTRTAITRVNQNEVSQAYGRTSAANEVFNSLCGTNVAVQMAKVKMFAAVLRCAAPLTAQEISDTEAYLASKSGVTL